jgi:hypothetical protein
MAADSNQKLFAQIADLGRNMNSLTDALKKNTSVTESSIPVEGKNEKKSAPNDSKANIDNGKDLKDIGNHLKDISKMLESIVGNKGPKNTLPDKKENMRCSNCKLIGMINIIHKKWSLQLIINNNTNQVFNSLEQIYGIVQKINSNTIKINWQNNIYDHEAIEEFILNSENNNYYLIEEDSLIKNNLKNKKTYIKYLNGKKIIKKQILLDESYNIIYDFNNLNIIGSYKIIESKYYIQCNLLNEYIDWPGVQTLIGILSYFLVPINELIEFIDSFGLEI